MIKYFSITILLFFLIAFSGFGQEKKISKFKSLSKRNLRLDREVPELLAEAEALVSSDVNEALNKVEEALALSITQKSSIHEAQCYLLLGKINIGLEEWESAAEHYLAALEKLGNDHKSSPEYYEILDGLAVSFKEIGNHETALYYQNQKLKNTNNPELLAETYIDMANVHFLAKEFVKGMEALETADSIIAGNNIEQLKSLVQATKAKILANTGYLDSAESLYRQSQQFEVAQNDFELSQKNEAIIEDTKNEIINSLSIDNRLEEEVDLRNQAIESNILKQRPGKVITEKQALGKVLIRLGNQKDAIRQLEDAIVLADSIGNYRALANANLALAKIWSDLGNPSRAISFYQAYSQAINEVEKQQKKEQQAKQGILKRQQEILALSKELALDESEYELQRTSSALDFNRDKLQRLIIYSLIIILFTVILASFFIYRNAQKSKTMSQLLALKSLRSQMNPHFIFNALNSVNQFIALNDERSANKFISEFSKLMRLVLDNSQEDFISLAVEKEIIELYLKLEHYRFRDKFRYSFMTDEKLSLDTITIPPMLIQPYIENAIWHGLRYKEENGLLSVSINKSDKAVVVEITDNGIGRKRSMELKTKTQQSHKSTGLKNTEERIRIINKVYHKNYSVAVKDINSGGSGTLVMITLPLNRKNE